MGIVTNVDFVMNGDVLASSAGAAASTSVELDFPGTNVFLARARDNRGAYGYSTQTVAHVTLPLHVLTLGGVRSNITFKLCLLGETGSNYLIFAATNIASPQTNWVQLGLMENTNGIWRYFDPRHRHESSEVFLPRVAAVAQNKKPDRITHST